MKLIYWHVFRYWSPKFSHMRRFEVDRLVTLRALWAAGMRWVLGCFLAANTMALAQETREVLVVVVQFADTETPVFSSEDWADELNTRLNDHFQSATQRMAPRFEFVAVPPVLELDYTYGSTVSTGIGDTPEQMVVDDPGMIEREGRAALIHARQVFPQRFEEPVTLMAILNRDKRGRASRDRTFFTFGDEGGLSVSGSLVVIADPIARFRAALGPPELMPQPNDSDGDGLTNADEAAFDGDPDDWDTDNDGLSDSVEAFETLTRLSREDTDADRTSDWVEVMLRTSDPTVFDTLRLPDGTISLVAHELGHILGLPDLYGDRRYFSRRPYQGWGLMASDSLQNFGAFSRSVYDWHRTGEGERVVDIGPGGLGSMTFTLIEPQRGLNAFSGDGVANELIRVRRPFLPDLMLEARPKVLNDTSRPALGFTRVGTTAGLPGSYQSGVLLSTIDPRFETDGANVRYLFGEPITEVVPFLGGNDPSPDQRSFAAIEGDVVGPGRLVIQAAVDRRESRIDIELDGTVVDSAEVTLGMDDALVVANFFVPLTPGVHQVSLRHSLPYDPEGGNGGRSQLSRIFLQDAPRITRQPHSVETPAGELVEIPIGVDSDGASPAGVNWQREAGAGIWNNYTGPAAQSDRLLFSAITAADAGRYRAAVSDGFGLVYSQPFDIDVLDPVADGVALTLGVGGIQWTQSSIVHPWDLLTERKQIQTALDLPENLPVSITAALEGPAVVRFDWLRQGGVFEYFVNETFVSSALQGGATAQESVLGAGSHLLRWTFTKNGDNQWGNIGLMRVFRIPSISGAPQSQVVTPGGFAQMEVFLEPSGLPTTTFQWFKDGTAIPGATNASFSVSNVRPEDAGNYFVRVGGVAGLPTVDSATASLSVRPSAAENLVGSVLDDVRMTWSETTNHQGWRRSGTRLVSDLDSPALANAPVRAGETYTDDKGLELQVGDYDATTGTYPVTLRSDPPPVFSDLAISHGWLDNPANGFGTFFWGRAGDDNDPVFRGDPVFVRRRPFIDFLGPLPFLNFEVITSEHEVGFRVRNDGLGPAEDITGTIFFLAPHIFIGPLLFDDTALSRVRLSELAFAQAEVTIASLGATESTVVTGTVTPDGPFQALLLLDRAENESLFSNNFHHAVFWTEFTSFGSPYEPVDLDIDFENVNPFRHHMYPQLAGLPNNWAGSITDPESGAVKGAVQLEPGESEAFQIQVSPPTPDLAKPGEAVEIGVEGWMDLGDTFVPMGEIPVVVALTHPTQVQLEAKVSDVDATLSGALRYRPLLENGEAGAPTGLADSKVSVEVAGSDGSLQILIATTGVNGGFVVTAEARLGVQYVGVAYYDGAPAYAPVESDPLEWGTAEKVVFTGLELSDRAVRENVELGTLVGEFKPLGGGAPLVFDLVPGEGSEDNERFKLDGPRLSVRTAIDYETDPQLSIRVRVTEQDSGAFLERVFRIEVRDDTGEDSDADGLSQADETKVGTSDFRLDSDGDGYGDALEIELGFDPSLEEDTPRTFWRETRRIKIQNPVSARWSSFDDSIYVGRRHVEGEDGLYRVDGAGRVRQVATGDRVAGVVVVPEQRSVYFSEDFSGTIFRVRIPLLGRDPLPGDAAEVWASTFHDGDDDPIGMALARFDVPSGAVSEGQVLVVDRGNNGPAEVWRFDPARVNSERVVHQDNDTLRAPVDVAIGRDAAYVIDEQAPVPRLRLFSIRGRGSLASVPHFALSGNGKAVVVDPLTQELLIMMDEGATSRIHRLNPITGARRVELDGFSSNPSRSCLDLSPDGQRLVVTDHTANEIRVFERRFLPSPEIGAFAPMVAQVGDRIRVTGSGLDGVTRLMVGGVVQTIASQAARELTFALAEGTDGGRISVVSDAGEAYSAGVLRIPVAPSAIRLTDQSVGLAQTVGAVVGRLIVEDQDPGDVFELLLLSNDEFPDHEFYRIEGAYLVIDQPLTVEQRYRHTVGVRATDQFGLSVDARFELVLQAPPTIVSEPESAMVSSGTPVVFQVSVAGTPPLIYQWFMNGEPVAGATTRVFNIPEAVDTAVGNYAVEVSNAYGSTTSASVSLSLQTVLERVRLESIAVDADGQITLGLLIEGEGEHRLALEWTRDFDAWEPLAERVFEVGVQTWTIPLLEGEARANFRLVSQP